MIRFRLFKSVIFAISLKITVLWYNLYRKHQLAYLWSCFQTVFKNLISNSDPNSESKISFKCMKDVWVHDSWTMKTKLLTCVCLTIKKKKTHQLNCINNVSTFGHHTEKRICEIFNTWSWKLLVIVSTPTFGISPTFAGFNLLVWNWFWVLNLA